MTIGAPGTGLYWTETVPHAQPPHAGHQAAFLVAVAVLAVAACVALGIAGASR